MQQEMLLIKLRSCEFRHNETNIFNYVEISAFLSEK